MFIIMIFPFFFFMKKDENKDQNFNEQNNEERIYNEDINDFDRRLLNSYINFDFFFKRGVQSKKTGWFKKKR